MELLAWLIIGVAATFALTWSMINEKVEGPFYIYDGIRKLAKAKFMPALVRDNTTCVICVSFYAAVIVAALLPVYAGQGWLKTIGLYFVTVYGLHGGVVWFYRYIKLMYQAGSDEF